MTRRVVLLAVAAAILIGAAPASPRILSIANVIARHEALNGQTVRVSGWLLFRCERFDCSIDATRDRAGPSLRIGGSAKFDRDVVARGAIGHKIVVEGRVNRTCFDHPKGDPTYDPETITACTDRADQLANPRLIAVLTRKK